MTIIGGGLLGLMLMATAAVAQESVAVRANMVKGNLPAEDPAAAAWSQAPGIPRSGRGASSRPSTPR